MKMPFRALALMLAGVLLLTGCESREGQHSSISEPAASSGKPEAVLQGYEPVGEAEGEPPQVDPVEEMRGGYIGELVQETIAQFIQPGMGEYQKAKAAFDYMIETSTLLDPVGLDLWRIRGDYAEPPPFVENRSLSILLFHIGKCEDYAAALTMLLRGMGIEAEYVPGLTYSTQGELVDHAWTVAKIDGVWYHLDCQLEQNISRHGSIRYKYFMRSDATMRESHRWGQNLIDSGLLMAAQNEEIARHYIPPACPENFPTPERYSFTAAESPDVAAVREAVDREWFAYETEHGVLPPLEGNIIPPVFGLEGYGPQD